jgi:hypothetical protein
VLERSSAVRRNAQLFKPPGSCNALLWTTGELGYPGYQPPVFFPPGDQAPSGSFNRTLDKQAADMLSISLLQARLKELNTGVKVEISDSWVFGS